MAIFIFEGPAIAYFPNYFLRSILFNGSLIIKVKMSILNIDKDINNC